VSTNTAFRFPFTFPEDVHPSVAAAARYSFNGIKDLNDAIAALNTKVNANTKGVASNTSAITTLTAVSAAPVVTPATPTHSEPLTDGNSNFIFANGDIVVATGVPG